MNNGLDIGEYYARKLEPELMGDMVYLYNAAFSANVTVDELSMRHIECHGAVKFVGYIAYHKETNEAAAYYGVFPTYVYYKGNKILAAQSGDTMTHPKHQKKGLFVSLALLTYDYCRTVGIQFVIGFPNNNSYHGLVKHLSFINYPTLKNIQLYENKFEFARFTQTTAFLSALHLKFVKHVLRLLFRPGSVFQNSNRFADDLIYTEHDAIYAKQKDTGNKFWLKIKDVNMLLKLDKNSLIIGDMDLIDPQNIAAIVRVLRIVTFFTGMRFLTAGMADTSFLFKTMAPLGRKVTDSQRLLLLNLGSALPLEKVSLLNSDIDVF